VAEFSGGTVSSDGGALLLQEADSKMNLLARLSECFIDRRNPVLIEHSIKQMIRQRVYALALGYEDLNDHEQLRQDPLLSALAGKAQPGTEPLAGKSTLNRMELGTGIASRYKKITFWRDSVDELLVSVFLEAHPVAPQQIVLDIDTTDMALHGNQEGKFYHGYYKHYCYLPLYIFCGDHVLCARLRPSSIGPAVGSRKEVERVVQQIRRSWPEVRIILRGDSGFCSDELMTWCEKNGMDFVVGMARNSRVEGLIDSSLAEAKQQFEATQQPARIFVEFEHETLKGTWSRKRRVVAKAEHINGKSNPRFIVTSLDSEGWEKQRERLHHASQSTAHLPVRHCLYAHEWSAKAGTANDHHGNRPSGHDPAQAPQDRRADPGHRSQSVGPSGQQLSLSGALLPGATAAPNLNAPVLRDHRSLTTFSILFASLGFVCPRTSAPPLLPLRPPKLAASADLPRRGFLV
jgi:hypothetical protein